MRKCSVDGCFSKHAAKGYCRKHYANFLRHGYPIKPFCTRPIKYKINGKGCFVCVSHSPGTDGYPQFRIRRKKWGMHRFIYTEMFGDIPDGLLVRHKCDNRMCINPEHLELGTYYDNNHDAIKRNRHYRGSGHHSAKLTEPQVIEMKKLIAKGMKTREIAEMYEVSYGIVYKIKSNQKWKHITLEGKS